jgi:hypothetical protein
MKRIVCTLAAALVLSLPMATTASAFQPNLTTIPSLAELSLPSLDGVQLLSGIQDDAKPPVQVDVKVDKGSTGFVVSPVWIAIGGLGALLLVVLIVMAARNRGETTVVR